MKLAVDRTVSKVRYEITHDGGLTIELDVYSAATSRC